MGIFCKEWAPDGQTVNQYHYTEIIEKLRKRVMQVCPNIAKKKWILQHDNAPAHAVHSVVEFLQSNCIIVILQPPYSLISHLATSFYFKK
jgi:hypothetical protein